MQRPRTATSDSILHPLFDFTRPPPPHLRPSPLLPSLSVFIHPNSSSDLRSSALIRGSSSEPVSSHHGPRPASRPRSLASASLPKHIPCKPLPMMYTPLRHRYVSAANRGSSEGDHMSAIDSVSTLAPSRAAVEHRPPLGHAHPFPGALRADFCVRVFPRASSTHPKAPDSRHSCAQHFVFHPGSPHSPSNRPALAFPLRIPRSAFRTSHQSSALPPRHSALGTRHSALSPALPQSLLAFESPLRTPHFPLPLRDLCVFSVTSVDGLEIFRFPISDFRHPTSPLA